MNLEDGEIRRKSHALSDWSMSYIIKKTMFSRVRCSAAC